MYHYVLFDLDGTLTDPKEGICKSVQYALHEMNIEEPNLDKLECFIGPPLGESFREFYGMDDAQCDIGIKKYRERFASVGLFENEIYPGMQDLLKHLKEKGVHMAIASSKPKPFVERILKHFDIDKYFEVVTGSDLNNKKMEKIDVMREALSALFHVPEDKIVELPEEMNSERPDGITANVQAGETTLDGDVLTELKKKAKRIIPIDDVLMIGDRKFDIEGAKHFMIDSIGVSYGYAADGELETCEATYITDDLDRVASIITGEAPISEIQSKNALQKSYHVLLPLVYDFVFTTIILLLLQFLLDIALKGAFRSYAGFFTTYSAQVAVGFDAFATLICATFFYIMYQKEKKPFISKVVERRINKKLKKDCAWIVGLGGALALFLNLLFSYLQIIASSATYKEVANVQYSVSIGWGVLIYGLIKPIEEELVFRGLIYGRMRQYFPVVFSIPISGLIFGAYHGNMVQLVYGCIMGCILAVLYEKYRSLKANILFHSAANIAVYLVSVIAVLNKALFSVVGIVGCGILAAGFAWIIIKK